MLRTHCALGAVALVALIAGVAVACGPSKPPMTPDSENEQQLPDLDGGLAAPPPVASGAPATK